MTSQDSIQKTLEGTRCLSQRMRATFDVSRTTCTIGTVSVPLEALRSDLFSLIEHAKIRIHKASVNQTAPLTEKQAKLLNDAIYSMSSILRRQEQLTTMQNRLDDRSAVVCGEDFQEQMNTLTKKLNAIAIEMAKLKRANDNILNIYSNYELENEDECESDIDGDTDSSEGNNTVFKR
ncbi:uncharacterized protein LOC131683991 [Topomyia yanbarensis]|uniref:uncharacterized protein LOC131683991 n=1 Tax=Topomyia yanbarensis TaxID=2498891 RepID=UPI00273B2EF5|nr:uncharacterized protein LOC131683991 [Topomyia yanbarensis]